MVAGSTKLDILNKKVHKYIAPPPPPRGQVKKLQTLAGNCAMICIRRQ